MKISNTQPGASGDGNPNTVSRIAAGMRISKAEVFVSHDIRIDGEIDGTIVSKGRVLIGETAVVHGDVVCVNADIWGHFEGNVTVRDTMTLKSGADMKGSIQTGKFIVELGSKLDGATKMISESEFDKLSGEPFKQMPSTGGKHEQSQPQQQPINNNRR